MSSMRSGAVSAGAVGELQCGRGDGGGVRVRGTDVVWFDAHGEATTPETTTSGFLDGMGMSILTGKMLADGGSGRFRVRALPGEAGRAAGGARSRGGGGGTVRRWRSVRRECAGDVGTFIVHFDLDVLDPSRGGVEPVGSAARAERSRR